MDFLYENESQDFIKYIKIKADTDHSSIYFFRTKLPLIKRKASLYSPFFLYSIGALIKEPHAAHCKSDIFLYEIIPANDIPS